MLKAYRDHVAERAALGIPPLPLDAKQTAELIELIKSYKPNFDDLTYLPGGLDMMRNHAASPEDFGAQSEAYVLLYLLTYRVPPGVDDAAKVKASFLAAVAHGEVKVGLISKSKATELLGTMVGG